jgi:dUTP pyrophosphatase
MIHSTNDLPFQGIIRKLKNGIEEHQKSVKKPLHYLSESMIFDGHDEDIYEVDQGIERHMNPFVINTLTGQDKDNPVLYEGIDWTYSDGQWKPPEPPPSVNPSKISKVSSNNNNNTNMQNDSGANRIVTDNMDLLSDVQMIDSIPMGGCNKHDTAAIVCTAIGTLTLYCTDGIAFKVKAYYSADVDGTIISPTAMVRQHATKFKAWLKYCNCEDNKGTIKLIGKDGQENLSFSIYGTNDLWYHSDDSLTPNQMKPKINYLSNHAKFELWHQRLAHVGINTLENLHKHVVGVPPLKGNAFYRCPSCMSGKLCTKRPIGQPTSTKGATIAQQPSDQPSNKHQPPSTSPTSNPDTKILPGQHFLMDFGFVRGKEYNIKSEDGRTTTSIDGKNSYLSIIDKATRFMWVFPTTSKVPPVDIVRTVLTKFKSNNPHRTVRVDQGGELGGSKVFASMINECGFTLEVTGSDASAQNGMIENPNRTFGQMMRCMLHSAELGPEYWSYALQHAVYIRNRITHYSIGKTPYEAMTGDKPDLSGLRIFGSRIYARKPGKRKAKIENNTYKGIFLGFSATQKNIYYIDEETSRIKIGTHVIYDEAHMTVPASKAPLAAQTLQRLGYYSKEDWIEDLFHDATQSKLLVQQLTKTSVLPTRSTKDSIGYDLHLDSEQDITIPAGTIMPLPTGIAIQCPKGTYGRIAPRSGLTVKQRLTTLAGVIDPDYRGNVMVLIQNFGEEHQILKKGQRIAQLILENASTPPAQVVNDLVRTERGTQGFGSTETRSKSIHFPIKEIIKLPPPANPAVPSYEPTDMPTHHSHTAAAAKLFSDIQTTFEPSYNINLNNNPYDNRTHRMLHIKPMDKDKFYGLDIQECNQRSLPKLIGCKPGTSAMRIPRWRSELRNSYITHIDNEQVNNMEDINKIFRSVQTRNLKEVKIGFATIEKQAMHPQLGVPQMYHDQMNIIGEHLWDIAHDPVWQQKIKEEIALPITPKSAFRIMKLTRARLGKDNFWDLLHKLPTWYKIATLKKAKKKRLTRRFLLQQDDWKDWEKSEHKQLNQYEAQKTFGNPCQLPTGANLLPLLWTYLIKDCGTKKARCVCNGSSKMKGTVTLGDTYAGSLEQTGSRIFWATTALYNFITIGADASNAFAEAPAPKAPLYVSIDTQFHQWYQQKYPDKPPIPTDFVLPVQGALQGHPESARLWAKLIDKIIKELNLKPCTHEPCLYYTKDYNGTGKTVLFLRQVDDFAVSCENKETATKVIKQINDKMTIDVKDLGRITRFNGVDVEQTRDYIKLYNATYIDKMLARHEWIHKDTNDPPKHPIPMIADSHYQRKLETAEIPTEAEISALETEFGFGYRQAVGEIIYALVTCRPDISYPIIKLSQYSTRPQRIHFEALRTIYRYLHHTRNEGIYFWRKAPRKDLPQGQIPKCKKDNNYKEEEIHERSQPGHTVMFGAVDSDYAGDTTHRRSVTGIILRIAGGTIFYKTKFQDTIALSSTEAEFTAAAEAGKYILYVRSIIEQLGIPQHEATTLYEDNQGALLMANAQQPTKRTRHMDIKTFVLQQWVEQDLIRLKRINTTDNYADVMTKSTGRTLFYRHMNYILGKIIPTYCRLNLSIPND